jgi:CRISPR type I-E-associated protein CasB/Cse2
VNPENTMSQRYQWRDDVRTFIQNLRVRCGSHPDGPAPQSGGRARLRHGATESRRSLAYSEVIRCGGRIRRYNGTPEHAWLAVGAAFAFYPQPPRDPGLDVNFGVTCRQLASETRDRDGESRFDAKFRRLLAAESTEDLAKWVVLIVKRAKNAKPQPAPVCYEELLTALLNWDAADSERRERIRIRWATSYWQPGAAETEEVIEL